MRTLMLMRHATTEDSRPGHRDDARRLTREGGEQAARLGAQLRAEGVSLDVVLCSSATRARQTAEALGLTAPVVVTDRLYGAGGDEILRLIRELEDDVERVLVVGHSPGMPAAIHELADPVTSDPGALETLERRFPSGTLATLVVDGPWADLAAAALVSIRVP